MTKFLDSTVAKTFKKREKEGEIGIEVEVEGKSLPTVVNDYWSVHNDGSLRGEAKEYVLIVPQDKEVAYDQVKVLYKLLDGKINDSMRAGVHIHLNCLKLTIRQLFTLMTAYYCLENLLTEDAGAERQGNLFCLRLTDSEKLIYALSKGWSIQKVMDTVIGAAAISWWDSSTKTFNLYRNKERTLFYTHNDLNSVYIYASEEWILRLALIKGKLPDMVKNIKEFPVDQHLEIVLGDNKINSVNWKKIDPYIKPQLLSNYNQHNYGGYYSKERSAVNLRNHKTPSYLAEVKKPEPFRSDSGWIDVKDLDEKEFNKVASNGCSYCSVDLEFEDYQQGFVKWLERDTPLCNTCAQGFKYAN